MRIAILTGGGDVPGLNPCIKAAVGRVEGAGGSVIGLRRGWAGLLHCNPDDPASIEANTKKLDSGTVRTIDRTGGTFLHTSRTNPGRVPATDVPDFLRDQASADGVSDFTSHILKVLEEL
ncbi:MAG: 6-phosphofructokinase, partial [Actinomycetia bacterium]|nr:6-phosphofructokinase [Actinomycetes bacterium]